MYSNNQLDKEQVEYYKINPTELFNELKKLKHSEIDSQSTRINSIILELNGKYDLDICKLATDAIENETNIFKIIAVIKPNFHLLKHNITSLLHFLKIIYHATQPSYDQFDLVNKLTVEQKETTDQLLKELLIIDEEFVVNYIAVIYECISLKDIDKVHSELVSLTETKEGFIIQGIVLALSRLDYWNYNRLNLAETTIEIYEKLLLKQSSDIDRSIAFSLGPFINKIDKAKKIVSTLINKKDPNVMYPISIILHKNHKEFHSDDWFIKTLYAFNETNLESLGVIVQIDLILKDFIKDESSKHIAETFLSDWIVKYYDSKKDKNIGELWPQTLAALNKDRKYLNKLVTKLLNADEYKYHLAASEIIRYVTLHFRIKITLDPQILSNLDFDSILFICRKIIGYIILPKESYALLDSIIQQTQGRKDITKLICDIYLSYLAKDYPQLMINLLNETVTSIKNKQMKDTINKVIKEINFRCEEYNSLPRLKELESSKNNNYQLAITERKRNQIMMKTAHEKSLLNILGKPTPLKYGTGWFHYVDDDYSDISKLGTFSQSIEMPQQEITQPVNSAYNRFMCKIAKRREL